MATEQKAGDVEIKVSRKKSKRSSEFQMKLRLNILEPLQKLLKSGKFWASVLGISAAAGGGWIGGRYAPLEERSLDAACKRAVEVRGKKRVGDFIIRQEGNKLLIEKERGGRKTRLVICDMEGYAKVATGEEVDF